MRRSDQQRAKELKVRLHSFNAYPTPGIGSEARLQSFIEQLVESLRRIEYIALIRDRNQRRPFSESIADPNNDGFDPFKAAAFQNANGNIDEAFWLVYLSVYFGKSLKGNWRTMRQVYGGLGKEAWDWQRISSSPQDFRSWLKKNQSRIGRFFGNHRKYETLSATSSRGTASAFESYVSWVGATKDHQIKFNNAISQGDRNPRKAFDILYKSMTPVVSFGRMAKFDYLTMVGKLGLAAIEPGSVYFKGATGPLQGAKLLFCGSKSATLSTENAEKRSIQLAQQLQVGMQVMEDALCNWQKSPDRFKPFRG